MSRLIKIIDGPQKREFFESLTHGNQTSRIEVRFIVAYPDLPDLSNYDVDIIVDVVIDEISREDGSGESWNFKGYCCIFKKRCNGYYLTSSSPPRGWIEF